MQQAAVLDVFSFDRFSPFQNALPAPDTDAFLRETTDAFLLSAVMVVIGEGAILHLKSTRQEVVPEQNSVHYCLIPSLDLRLFHRLIWHSAHQPDFSLIDPNRQIVRVDCPNRLAEALPGPKSIVHRRPRHSVPTVHKNTTKTCSTFFLHTILLSLY